MPDRCPRLAALNDTTGCPVVLSRLSLDGVTSASSLAAWQTLRTRQWAVIDGAVGDAAAARLRQEIVELRQVRR